MAGCIYHHVEIVVVKVPIFSGRSALLQPLLYQETKKYKAHGVCMYRTRIYGASTVYISGMYIVRRKARNTVDVTAEL